MNPRYPPLMLSGLGTAYGAFQFFRGLSNDASWGIQMGWVALFLAGVFLVRYFLRHNES